MGAAAVSKVWSRTSFALGAAATALGCLASDFDGSCQVSLGAPAGMGIMEFGTPAPAGSIFGLMVGGFCSLVGVTNFLRSEEEF